MTEQRVTLEVAARLIPDPQPTFDNDGNAIECRCDRCRDSRAAKALIRKAQAVVDAARLQNSVWFAPVVAEALTALDRAEQGHD